MLKKVGMQRKLFRRNTASLQHKRLIVLLLSGNWWWILFNFPKTRSIRSSRLSHHLGFDGCWVSISRLLIISLFVVSDSSNCSRSACSPRSLTENSTLNNFKPTHYEFDALECLSSKAKPGLILSVALCLCKISFDNLKYEFGSWDALHQQSTS